MKLDLSFRAETSADAAQPAADAKARIEQPWREFTADFLAWSKRAASEPAPIRGRLDDLASLEHLVISARALLDA